MDDHLHGEKRPPVRPSLDRERALLAAAQSGDGGAREELVETFMPLVAAMARRYRNAAGVDREELMQEGVVGLLRAAQRYDAEWGRPFWAYASWWVRQAMQQLVAELARPVILSDRALRQLARVRQAHRDHLQAAGHEPTTTDLARRSSLPRERVESLIAVDRTPRALEEPLGGDEDRGGMLGDMLSDPRAQDDYERVDRRLEIERLRALPQALGERELAILCAHYGIDCPSLTLREIAGLLNLSAERVRQVEERALGKLRLALAS
ncbi:MAG: polymerase primary sigma factor [Thermoleophilaceae bacterium]|jgi:RNA polymerase sigma factor (sigma-70 family)|nr:polymerase primary sigma factor [Thermoleophilaceae bacterium]